MIRKVEDWATLGRNMFSHQMGRLRQSASIWGHSLLLGWPLVVVAEECATYCVV